jgi:hypothetical protein
MIIETDNDDLAAIGDTEVRRRNDGNPVTFGDDTTVRVRAAVGEYLAEHRADITIVDDERQATDDEGDAGDGPADNGDEDPGEPDDEEADDGAADDQQDT